MKKIFTIILLLVTISCQRNQPGDSIADPTVTSLKQLAYYQTSVPEPSGLCYNSKTNSLFTVSDGNGTVYEINFTGKILQSFMIPSSDLEGITFSANNDTMYVVEETDRLVSKYFPDGRKISSFTVDVATASNSALEGITIDNNNHIIVINEKKPCMILEFIGQKEILRKEINYVIDLSDIFYEKSTNTFWIVSDESQKVIQLSRNFSLIGQWGISFKKGEGITIVNNKIYIVNDSNGILYEFERPN